MLVSDVFPEETQTSDPSGARNTERFAFAKRSRNPAFSKSTRFLAAALVSLSLASLVSVAQAAENETPKGTYIIVDRGLDDPGQSLSHSSNLIYLNGCFNGGCDISPGVDDSIANTSSIINTTAHIPAFEGGAVQWEAVVDCVRETYGLFDIEITDVDPGTQPHFEAIVAGTSADIGMGAGVGGVAPFECGEIINNAITFSFAGAFPDDVAQICWIVAQETAHAFGLDHEYLCSDPLTYLQSCEPDKRFQDQDAQCGEYEPRPCYCDGNTQNSYQRLLTHFGAGEETPPVLTITEPADGAEVSPGFDIRVNATDDMRIDRLELRINSVTIATINSEPYIFEVPASISDGFLQVEVTAYDNYDFKTTEALVVLRGAPCSSEETCEGAETCVDGRCVPGPGAKGGLGEVCESNDQCASKRCGHSESGSFCAETCELDANGCPSGFHCLNTGDDAVCWQRPSSGGCSVAGTKSSSLLWLVGFALVIGFSRRRRPLA